MEFETKQLILPPSHSFSIFVREKTIIVSEYNLLWNRGSERERERERELSKNYFINDLRVR